MILSHIILYHIFGCAARLLAGAQRCVEGDGVPSDALLGGSFLLLHVVYTYLSGAHADVHAGFYVYNQSSTRARQQPIKHLCKQASQQASKPASQQASKPASERECVRECVSA